MTGLVRRILIGHFVPLGTCSAYPKYSVQYFPLILCRTTSLARCALWLWEDFSDNLPLLIGDFHGICKKWRDRWPTIYESFSSDSKLILLFLRWLYFSAESPAPGTLRQICLSSYLSPFNSIVQNRIKACTWFSINTYPTTECLAFQIVKPCINSIIRVSHFN